MIPKFPLLKEWAYAGFFFVMSGAVFLYIASGDSMNEIAPSLVSLILIVVSWYFRPADRKIISVNQYVLKVNKRQKSPCCQQELYAMRAEARQAWETLIIVSDIAVHFISGVILSICHPFAVGDMIGNSDYYGYVHEINLRCTILETTQGQLVVIPFLAAIGFLAIRSLLNKLTFGRVPLILPSKQYGIPYSSRKKKRGLSFVIMQPDFLN